MLSMGCLNNIKIEPRPKQDFWRFETIEPKKRYNFQNLLTFSKPVKTFGIRRDCQEFHPNPNPFKTNFNSVDSF